MVWVSHDDQNHKQLHWDTVSGDAFRLWYGLVGECVALRKWDGVLPRYVAMCATPGLLPRFEELLAELSKVDGLIEDRGGEIELLQIEQHIPREGQRPDVMGPRKAFDQSNYRRRKCERGDHSKDCPPASCPVKLAKAESRRVTKRVAGNAGTGRVRDGTSPLQTNPALEGKEEHQREREYGWEECPRCGALGPCDCE